MTNDGSDSEGVNALDELEDSSGSELNDSGDLDSEEEHSELQTINDDEQRKQEEARREADKKREEEDKKREAENKKREERIGLGCSFGR